MLDAAPVRVGVSRLPEQAQDALAEWLLQELASERRWEKALAGSVDQLGKLAGEALTEHREGHTQELDPDKM